MGGEVGREEGWKASSFGWRLAISRSDEGMVNETSLVLAITGDQPGKNLGKHIALVLGMQIM